MREYRFVTTWRVEAPRAAVWDAIRHSERWPAWWSGVVRVEELAAGEPDGVGNLRRYTFRSRLPYALTFDVHATLVDPPARLWGDAQGDLVGTGRWFFATEEPGVTLVRYGWHVATTSRWMNLLGP